METLLQAAIVRVNCSGEGYRTSPPRHLKRLVLLRGGGLTCGVWDVPAASFDWQEMTTNLLSTSASPRTFPKSVFQRASAMA